jgi:phosphoglycolate phosphatase-like HAD superfamily hydrolase
VASPGFEPELILASSAEARTMKTAVSVLIVDLDDTLWDWVGVWHACFKAMLDQLVQLSGLPASDLLRDFKEVFTRHGTSEYAFAIEELRSLREKHPSQDVAALYRGAVDAYREARREALKLYPTVQETLETIKDSGALVIGYTESKAFYSRYRLRRLGLDRVLDYLYSPEDDDLPEGLNADQIRHYESEHYALRRTIHRHTPKGEHKPSAKVLLGIIHDVGATPEDVVYVGDKLFKDAAMAQSAGVADVWAKYGEAHRREEYELLRQVTHWSANAVQNEQTATAATVNPSYILENTFSEILSHFTFRPFADKSQAALGRVVEVWKKTVDVQQHFNDLEMRIRNYAVTVAVAVIGASGLVLRDGISVSLFGLHIPLASLFLLGGAMGLTAFWFMDRHWYHRLLYGAVKHAADIEARHKRDLPDIGLSEAIKKESPFRLGKISIHSSQKLSGFYFLLIAFFIALAVLVFLSDLADGKKVSAVREAKPSATPVVPPISPDPRRMEHGVGNPGDA